MSLARTFGVVVLAITLTTALVTGNVLAAAHFTVLDPDFVSNSIEEEGGYGIVEDTARQAAGIGPPSGDVGSIDTSTLIEEAISEEYLASQTEANVDRTYAYLHGERETLNLSVSTAPVRENISEAVEQELRNASIAEFVGQSGAEFAGPINASTLERMTANESGYRDAKSDFRAQIREEVLDAAVDRAFEESSNDELLALVIENYDPDDYTEAEKERMVADREAEIRAALRERIERERGDEIDATVEDQLAAINQQATTNSTDAESEMAEAIASIQNTIVRGLTTNMSYQTFQTNLSAAKADMAAATADELTAAMPNRIDLTENMGTDVTRAFEQARTGVQWLDRLAFIVPAAIVGLIGLLYAVRRSVTAVASDTGWSMLSAGVPTVIGLQFAKPKLQSMVDSAPAEQQQLLELLVGIAGRVLNTLGDVALAMSVGGVVLVAGSLAVRYGLIDRVLALFDDGYEDTGRT